MATPKAKLEAGLRTVAEYLELERIAEERHEFIDGVIRAMAGESPRHSLINANLIGEVALVRVVHSLVACARQNSRRPNLEVSATFSATARIRWSQQYAARRARGSNRCSS